MRSEWRDPDDITPGARRTPKMVVGWRSYDPLRLMLGHAASGITTEHIMAADKLREAFDLATIGYSADRPLIFVAQQPAPRFGLGPDAVAQMRACRTVRRVVALFMLRQLAMIDMVILRNVPLRIWTQALLQQPASQAVEKGRLLAILDVLAQHFATEVDDDLARGRRLPP